MSLRVWFSTMLVCGAAIASAQVRPDGDSAISGGYHYSVLRPAAPKAGDSVSLFHILGLHHNTCIPGYSTKIVDHVIMESYPPKHHITVAYEQLPEPAIERMCGDAMTEYGPVFKLGTVKFGSYTVILNGETIASFRVPEPGTVTPPQSPPAQRYILDPQQPQQGETVRFTLIQGFGSSSCAPQYTTSIVGTTVSDDGSVFFHTVAFVDKNVDYEGQPCTMDYVPHGPRWIFADAKAGTHIIMLDTTIVARFWVSAKREPPTFQVATIQGTVYRDRETPVAQCTVALILPGVSQPDAPTCDSGADDCVTVLRAPVSAYTVTRFLAVTDEAGGYVLPEIPSELLLTGGYLTALHGNLLGHARIPWEISEIMTLNIVLFEKQVYVDQMPLFRGDEVTEQLRDVAKGETASSAISKQSNVPKGMRLDVTGPTVRLINPVDQHIVIGVYALDGRLLWSSHSKSLRAKGEHYLPLPVTVRGMVVIRVKGEVSNASIRARIIR